MYTLDQRGMDAKITQAKNMRKTRLEEHQDLLVEMRPEFVAALKYCNSFSSKILCNCIVL